MSGKELSARDALIGKLRLQDRVNDMFTGDSDAATFEASSKLWPGNALWSEIRFQGATEAGNRRFEEYHFIPGDGSREHLPVGFMFESNGTGGSVVRVYSDHHLVEDRAPILEVVEGIHLVEDRAPILEVVEGIHPWASEQDVLFTYFKALGGNQLEDVLDLFDADGYFRHSNGETFKGREELRQDFSKMMGNTGIKVRYCQFTDDGKTCVGEVYMPSGRPAIALYQRSSTPGRLHAVRIYL